jgi:hypothetical protein
MNTIEIAPIPHDQLKEHFPHVFNNDFETREIEFVYDSHFDKQHYCWFGGYSNTKGDYTDVLVTRKSDGKQERIHFWKMAGDYKNNYKTKYCYSIQREK